MIPTERERSASGTQRANKLYVAGNIAASPSPMAMRTAISTGSDMNAATGVSMVKIDQDNTAKPRTILPPILLASQPLGACRTM